MNIALIGYGTMGNLVGSMAAARDHEIAVIVNETHKHLAAGQLSETLRAADVAIDFSAAPAVRRNVEACMMAGVPLVEGTTGWRNQQDEIEHIVLEAGGALVFGSNFSIGANLFFRIVDFAAGLASGFPDYEAFVEEQHHSMKKDAPSGTALKLKDILSKHTGPDISVASTRAGNIPGTHRVGFDGRDDEILLVHEARGREGFAAGALLAADWIRGRKGCYEFTVVMDEIIEGMSR